MTTFPKVKARRLKKKEILVWRSSWHRIEIFAVIVWALRYLENVTMVVILFWIC